MATAKQLPSGSWQVQVYDGELKNTTVDNLLSDKETEDISENEQEMIDQKIYSHIMAQSDWREI